MPKSYAPTHSSDPPANLMSDEEKKNLIAEQVTLWVGNLRIDQALKSEELGQLKMVQKMVALRNSLIIGCIRYCQLNPRGDTRLAILTLITFLADNNNGICHLSVTAMTELFQRSRETIVNGIKLLEEQGQIGVYRRDGMPNRYWPLIPAALAEISANPVWLLQALRASRRKPQVLDDPEGVFAVLKEKRSSAVDQSNELDRSSGGLAYQSSSFVQPVNSGPYTGQVEPDSTSTTNSAPHLEKRVPNVDEAIALYNKAASEHGITPCSTLTDSRRRRLIRRLEEIGGIQTFAKAMSALPRMPFLLGRTKKLGQAPFIVDLDMLLSTETRMGDVLARLLDLTDLDNRSSGSETEAQRKVREAVGDLNWDRFQARGSNGCGHA